MAIKSLMLRRKIDAAKAERDKIREKSAALKEREAEILESIEEATTQEEQDAIDSEIESLNNEQGENDKAASEIERTISELEKELAEEESRMTSPKRQEEREDIVMPNLQRRFKSFTHEERSAFAERSEVREFLEKFRELRGITGGEILIPETVFSLMREEVYANSKLIGHVSLRQVRGTSRQPIMGVVPEAAWVESSLKEITLGFSQIKMDGYMVGAYIVVANTLLEDNDVSLLSEIITAMGESIAKALDKAILYGTGSSMPLGVVTRLAQTARPSDYPSDGPAWKDLHSSNITKFASASMTGEAFFKKLGEIFGLASSKYAQRPAIWVMNHKTAIAVKAFGINFNAAGAIVSGVNNQMPVWGGDIVELECVPDGDIIPGYFDMYPLVERSGAKVESSEHAQFLQNNTVFKGIARYDGKPADAAAFVAVNINNTNVTTTGFYTAANAPTE